MRRKPNIKNGHLLFCNESGAVIVLVAISLVALLAFAALAVDIGHLVVVRNELQNAADAAALAGAQVFFPRTPSLTPLAPDWALARTTAANAIQLNRSDGQTLVDCLAETGYWDFAGSPPNLQPTTITPGNMHAPAVRVTVRRDAGANGGPVTHFFASIMGINSSPSNAQAVAVCASPGVAFPGAVLPIAITQAMANAHYNYDSYAERFRIGSDYHYPSNQAGQWTSLKLDTNNVPTIRQLITNGNPDTLSIGEDIWIQPGTKNTIYDEVPIGRDVLLPVVSGTDLSTHSHMTIVGFIGFHITDSRGANLKYVEGYFLPNFYSGLSGPVGPNYGVVVPPKLVQ